MATWPSSIAKRGLVLNEAEPIIPLTRSIERLGRLVAARLKDVLDAYANGDVARAVTRSGFPGLREVDEHYNSLFRELLTYMMGDPRTITAPALICCSSPRTSSGLATTPPTSAEIVHFDNRDRRKRWNMPWPQGQRASMSVNQPRILVVEDEEALAQLPPTIISTRKVYRVAIAYDGEEATIQADEETPGSGGAGLDAAASLSGIEVSPPPALGPQDPQCADHHADCPRRRNRPGARLDTGADDPISSSRCR